MGDINTDADGQMVLDIPNGHTLSVEADNHVIDIGEFTGALGAIVGVNVTARSRGTLDINGSVVGVHTLGVGVHSLGRLVTTSLTTLVTNYLNTLVTFFPSESSLFGADQ